MRRGDFSMVRIRLARFALPRLGLGGSKSGVSCSPLVGRVRGTVENVRASAARPEAVSIALRDHRLSETTNFEKVGPTYFLNLESVFSLSCLGKYCRLHTKSRLRLRRVAPHSVPPLSSPPVQTLQLESTAEYSQDMMFDFISAFY